MDLNHLYSQHQIALMKAGAAATLVDRCQHLHSAAEIAGQIGSYQLSQGAGAGKGWRDGQLRLSTVAPSVADGTCA